ncbi:glycoside hydrolase family 32 protein [Melghirimyces algeriensis]|uniref:Sucrose-6-phosphate hydrolase n=1 Tax=Melghirimyces algeriensis TaxID=910412 RepID=A0A521C7Q9_9BACL|nr:sucrose-6-phosphate hydrolase [Melghirimyces algeriensis]SMO55405.1 beta-fructofuranosidase [Melghirimyces algeriensis]
MNSTKARLTERVRAAVVTYGAAAKRDPYRLHYHLTPLVGLLNDPNGFVQYRGEYHLFYQWNPFITEHGSKFWGHWTSMDLVNWRAKPVALAPDEWYDKNGCYSGSAVEHEGKLILFYTGNVRDEQGGRETYQCMAISEDGIRFRKHGPVIHLPQGYTPHFRDPKVWRKDGSWYMVVGAQSRELQGQAVLFRSSNLRDWTYLGPIAGSGLQCLGEFGYMWECPDLFRLNGRGVLIVCPQGLEPEGDRYHNLYQSGYFLGDLEEEVAKFDHGPFDELDRGFDFYAPQTTLDNRGRRLLFGWMGLPDGEEHHPTVAHHWIHAMTLPRELRVSKGRLIQRPVEELCQLRRNEVVHSRTEICGKGVALEGVDGEALEIEVDLLENRSETFAIDFRGAACLIYDRRDGRLMLERTAWKDGKKERRFCRIDRLARLRIFLDASSIEIFVNEGEEVFTSRFYPDVDNRSIAFSAPEGITVDLKKWELASVPIPGDPV